MIAGSGLETWRLNDALLAKQVWRLVKDDNSPMAWLLRAKYTQTVTCLELLLEPILASLGKAYLVLGILSSMGQLWVMDIL